MHTRLICSLKDAENQSLFLIIVPPQNHVNGPRGDSFFLTVAL